MKTLLKLEELAQFAFCLSLLIMFEPPWWCYLLLLLGPDISFLGYLVNTRTGAFVYNFFHHKGIALLVVLLAVPGMIEVITLWQLDMGSFRYTPPLLAGLVLYGHASMDRIFGYGLKFGDNFHHTHLGWIGKGASKVEG